MNSFTQKHSCGFVPCKSAFETSATVAMNDALILFKLVIIKDQRVRSMSPGFLSFAKLVMMSSAPANSAGDARYASQDPFIRSLSHTRVMWVTIWYLIMNYLPNLDSNLY